MNPWASHRKSIYLGGIILLLTAVSFGIFWKFWYKTPTCFDNVKNGDETGVDCGGSCSKVCSSGVIQPIVMWDPRMFEISPGVWSLLVYVENPNTDVDATYVPYTFTIYNANNKVLEQKTGATILPKNKTVGIFEGPISIPDENKPQRVIFELGGNIIWNKNENPSNDISITNSPLSNLDSQPRVQANVRNNSTKEIDNIELVAAIFDGSDNAVAASRTFIDSLPKNTNTNVLFTWPRPFDLGSKACEKPSDVMLLLDRSGSMSVLGANPPEPLSTAKDAAATFIDQLNNKDKIGVVSFATSASNPIDFPLSSNLNSAKQAVLSINIEASSTQYTNIYDALHSSWQELVSGRAQDDSSKVIVLLTDGVANSPRYPLGHTEADDIKFAENLATADALNAKKDGISIYTVGLGQQINESFLKTIASTPDDYFFAPSASNLETIYKNISSSICKEIPARIEITYKIFGNSI